MDRITVYVYPSFWRLSKGYRWTAVAPNGRKIATIGESNRSKKHVVDMATAIFPTAEIKFGRPPR